MPSYLTDVTIATEDKRFLEHHGVDWKRTAAAAINMFIPILDRQEGGSTITQQLIKNATDNWAPNVERKVKEIFSALKLEKKYSKTDICLLYTSIMQNEKSTAPSMVREYKIGNTTYVVKSHSRPDATEDAVSKVRRPVSYTHLDVYKRQVLHRSEVRPFEPGCHRYPGRPWLHD